MHQNKVVATARGHEVSADPTNSLALEAARRRRGGSAVQLATVQRVVRAQTLPPGPGYYAHFSLFGMVAAGRWSTEFAEESLLSQWTYIADRFPGTCVRWTDLSNGKLEALYQRVAARLADRLTFEADPARANGHNYYVAGCFKLYVAPTCFSPSRRCPGSAEQSPEAQVKERQGEMKKASELDAPGHRGRFLGDLEISLPAVSLAVRR